MPKQSNRKQKIKHILSSSLDVGAKLKQADPDIQEYVRALEDQCLNLYSKYFKMKAENVTLKRRVLDLEKSPRGKIVIRSTNNTDK